LACLAAILVPVVYYNSVSVRIYQSSVSIIYENPHQPITTVQQQPYRYPVKESLLNQIQEIRSRSVALETSRALPDWAKNQFPTPKNPRPQFDKTAYIAAIIKGNLEAVPVAESDVIQIRARAEKDPYLAMTLANTLCDVLQDRNLRIRREGVSDMRNFLDEQRESYKRKLDDAELALRQFKVNNRVTALDKEVEEELKLAKNIELQYQQAKNEKERNQQYLLSVQQEISKQQLNLAPSIANISNQIVQQLKNQLTQLQDSYIKLQLQGVPESNSKMVQMKDDIDRVRLSLAEEARRFAENEHIIDPVSQISSLYQSKVDLELKLQMLETQENSLAQSLSQYEGSLRRLPEKEFELARLTRDRDLANNLYVMLSERREEARISEAEKVGNMRVIDRAQLPKKPILPRKELNLAIGLMLGLTIGLGLAFFMESLDTTLKTSEDIERKIGLAVLGSIPRVKNLAELSADAEKIHGNPAGLITHMAVSSPASEAYRTLRTNLQFSNLSKKINSIMLTSSGPREGKSTTSSNLAVTMAQMGLRTLLIDADLRRPTIHKIFNINREPGLADILLHYNSEIGQTDYSKNGDDSDLDSGLDDQHPLRHASVRARKAVQQMVSLDIALSAAIHKTKVEHLEVLTCGLLPSNPSEILSGETMKDLMALVKEKYEFIIIDAPPVIAVTDAAVLAPQMDAVLMVTESARNDRDIMLKAKGLLDRVGANLMGAVLNNVHERNLYGDYDYYYKYYSEMEDKQQFRKKRRS
jgi:uncharacterized protein involved in exopolysaccharide biosynthesis/Mrp family chromosome partitioning ATPase